PGLGDVRRRALVRGGRRLVLRVGERTAVAARSSRTIRARAGRTDRLAPLSCDTPAMDVAVIGAGRVGTAIAILLRDAGHRITALAGREATRERAARFLPGVPVIERDAAAKTGELVLLGVPDDAIADVALGLSQDHALHEGQWIAH